MSHPVRTERRLGGIGIALAGIAGIAVVGAVDYMTGYEIALSLFYVQPIAASPGGVAAGSGWPRAP